jgi:hypothetical protein
MWAQPRARRPSRRAQQVDGAQDPGDDECRADRISPEQAPASRDQARPELHDRDGGSHAPEHGARRSDGVGNSLEQVTGVGQGAARLAETIGIYAHDSLKWSGARQVPAAAGDLARAGPPDAVDARHQVMERFQQRKRESQLFCLASGVTEGFLDLERSPRLEILKR